MINLNYLLLGGTTQSDFFYNTKQYQNFSSIGVGTHTFNYQDISVTIDGRIGISSIEGKPLMQFLNQ